MRILIIRNDVLGDAVVSSTVIEVLFRSLAGVTIDVLCNRYNEIAFRHNPHIHNIYVLDHQQASQNLAADFSEVISRINHSVAYTAIFVLNPCLRNFKYASLIATRYIFARRLATRSYSKRAWLLGRKLSAKWHFITSNPEEHEVRQLYHLVHTGLKRLACPNILELPEQCTFYLPFASLSSQNSRNGVIINVSGNYSQQRYINDSLLYCLLSRLARQSLIKLALLATEVDVARVRAVMATLSVDLSAVPLIVNNDLMQIAQEISQFQNYIGSDGGITHIAAGLGLNCITLFDKQPSSIWHPWSARQISLQTKTHDIYDISYMEVLKALQDLDNTLCWAT